MPTNRDSSMPKAQAAMDFLNTYMWAIIIIAIVIGAFAYLGIFSGAIIQPRAAPGICSVYRSGGPLSVGGINLIGVCDGEVPRFVFVSKGLGDFELVNSSTSLSSGLNISNNITITAWVYLYGAPYHDVVDKEAQYGMKLNYNNYPHACSPSNSNTLCLEWDTANSWIGQSYPIPNGGFNRWIFLAVSSNKGLYKYWYANGQQIGNEIVTTSQPTATGACSIYATAVPLAIGGDAGIISNTPWYNQNCFPGYGGFGGAKAEWFNGSVTNVQIYNTSLSSNQISLLYKGGIAGAPTQLQNLVGWWPLNGNGNDYSGDNNGGYTYNSYYSGGSWSVNYSSP